MESRHCCDIRKRRYICSSLWQEIYRRICTFLPKVLPGNEPSDRSRDIESFAGLASIKQIAQEHNISAPTATRYFKLVNYKWQEPAGGAIN